MINLVDQSVISSKHTKQFCQLLWKIIQIVMQIVEELKIKMISDETNY